MVKNKQILLTLFIFITGFNSIYSFCCKLEVDGEKKCCQALKCDQSCCSCQKPSDSLFEKLKNFFQYYSSNSNELKTSKNFDKYSNIIDKFIENDKFSGKLEMIEDNGNQNDFKDNFFNDA